MSIFKADKDSVSDRFDNHPSSRKLDNILNDISDESGVKSSSKLRSNILPNATSNAVTNMKGGKYNRPHRVDRYPQRNYAKPTILPDVLATESIESMLSRIENSLFQFDTLAQTNSQVDNQIDMTGGNLNDTAAHHSESSIASTHLTHSTVPVTEFGLTDKLNNSLIQEIDMLVTKIQSEPQ
jgi:hypothetical protein